MGSPEMRVFSYKADVDRMLDEVRERAFETPKPIHIDLYPGPSPDGQNGSFVVATWMARGELYAAWAEAGAKMPERLSKLFDWTMRATLRGLTNRGGMAHAQAWPWPESWQVEEQEASTESAKRATST